MLEEPAWGSWEEVHAEVRGLRAYSRVIDLECACADRRARGKPDPEYFAEPGRA